MLLDKRKTCTPNPFLSFIWFLYKTIQLRRWTLSRIFKWRISCSGSLKFPFLLLFCRHFDFICCSLANNIIIVEHICMAYAGKLILLTLLFNIEKWNCILVSETLVLYPSVLDPCIYEEEDFQPSMLAFFRGRWHFLVLSSSIMVCQPALARVQPSCFLWSTINEVFRPRG